ncbi:ABC transporter substrate-binding protein [Paenibacillus humicola]|uniref:ABC transporter substrate-binding protein n=1 Tax=Paenibacillus humicola TaxID=3110540 RepID=UPI00237B0574|nr:sugar ABC transporter substrate-binding protein [Paenibacillus humicola]
MRRMGRNAVISAVVIVCLIFVSACGSNGGGNSGSSDGTAGNAGEKPQGSGSAGKGGPVTIKLTFTSGEISKEQIAEFEKANPGIKIQQVDADYNKLMTMVAAGSAPDIIRIYAATELPNYVMKGLAMDLTPRFAASSVFKEDDYLPVVNLYKYDTASGKQGIGDIYGFPKDWSQDFTLFYNKQIFQKAGIPLPSSTEPMTWTELLDLAKKLTKKQGDKVSQYGLVYYNGNTALNQDLLLLQLAQEGSSIYSDDFGKADLNKPEVKNLMNYWLDAVKSDVGPNPLNQDTTFSGDLFVNGSAAMMISGYWFTGLLRGDEKAKTHLNDFGMAPAPVMEGGTRMSPTGAAAGGIIYSKTKHPDEAWKVFEWFLGGKPADDRAKSGWGLPATKSRLALLPNTTEFDKSTLAFVNNELKYADKFIGYNPYISAQAAASLFDKHFSPVYFGKSTVDEAASKITNDMNVLIQEGKDVLGLQ